MARVSTATLLLDIKAELGELRAEVRHVAQSQGRADESRQRMYARLDGMQRDITETRQTVRRIAPLVDQHEERRQRGIGKRQLIANQKTAIVGFATGGAWLVAKLSPLGAWLPDWLAKVLFIR